MQIDIIDEFKKTCEYVLSIGSNNPYLKSAQCHSKLGIKAANDSFHITSVLATLNHDPNDKAYFDILSSISEDIVRNLNEFGGTGSKKAIKQFDKISEEIRKVFYEPEFIQYDDNFM